ncbi:MAG: hypothetical protein BWX50_01126 [Euryarchaeota archaeon ADurb.Bin009]|nr:MAG: hypothetical protein BWX50_01126 [Euryarchaeota archaeon ADurb.Bin009]
MTPKRSLPPLQRTRRRCSTPGGRSWRKSGRRLLSRSETVPAPRSRCSRVLPPATPASGTRPRPTSGPSRGTSPGRWMRSSRSTGARGSGQTWGRGRTGRETTSIASGRLTSPSKAASRITRRPSRSPSTRTTPSPGRRLRSSTTWVRSFMPSFGRWRPRSGGVTRSTSMTWSTAPAGSSSTTKRSRRISGTGSGSS